MSCTVEVLFLQAQYLRMYALVMPGCIGTLHVKYRQSPASSGTYLVGKSACLYRNLTWQVHAKYCFFRCSTCQRSLPWYSGTIYVKYRWIIVPGWCLVTQVPFISSTGEVLFLQVQYLVRKSAWLMPALPPLPILAGPSHVNIHNFALSERISCPDVLKFLAHFCHRPEEES